MRNNFWIGAGSGIIFPLVAYVVTTFTSIQASLFVHKPITLYVIAATINLVAVRFLYRKGKDAAANGIVFATFLAMILLIFVMRELVFSYS